MSTLQVLPQAGPLKIAEGLLGAEKLLKELLNFKVKISDSAQDLYGLWRQGTHDDLVLSVALACYYAERRKGYHKPSFNDSPTSVPRPSRNPAAGYWPEWLEQLE